MTRYRLWTPTNWMILTQGEKDREPSIVSEGAHELGTVPLVAFYDERLGPMQGGTIADDVALQADALWQYRSVRDESMYIHGIQQLVFASDNSDITKLDMGAARAIQIGRDDSLTYLQPSDVVYSSYTDVSREIIEDVADLIFARTSRQLPTGQVESADKRRADREEFIAVLEQKAANFEEAERRCWELANQWAGGVDSDVIEITYNRDFEAAETLADEWIKRIQEGVAKREDWYRELHPGVDEEEAAAMEAENLAARGSATRDVLGGLRDRLGVTQPGA